MKKKAERSERRKYRRYDMPGEKRDAFLIWDDQAIRAECVDFSAGGCAIVIDEIVEFETGQIVVLKNDHGKFRASIANISFELGKTRLGCEYIESVLSELDLIPESQRVIKRKFKSYSLSDPTMLMGLLLFGIMACVLYTFISNLEMTEDDNSPKSRIAHTQKRSKGPKDFSTHAGRISKSHAFSRTIANMGKRVEQFKKEQRKYIKKIQQRVVVMGNLLKSMGVDTQAIIKSIRSMAIRQEGANRNSDETGSNTENKTPGN